MDSHRIARPGPVRATYSLPGLEPSFQPSATANIQPSAAGSCAGSRELRPAGQRAGAGLPASRHENTTARLFKCNLRRKRELSQREGPAEAAELQLRSRSRTASGDWQRIASQETCCSSDSDSGGRPCISCSSASRPPRFRQRSPSGAEWTALTACYPWAIYAARTNYFTTPSA